MNGECLQVRLADWRRAHLGLYPVAQRIDVLWSSQPDGLHDFDSIGPQVLILQGYISVFKEAPWQGILLWHAKAQGQLLRCYPW